ncbi:MAG: T9SS type A sorting domain-containing protein, partial [Paludibacteraceae bacterium]|nr:T9SS type A sorting domain-containing protein [Paludibacteraceae bacterium]
CWIEGYGYEYMILDGLSFYLSSVEDEDGVLIDFSEVTDAYVPMVVEGYSWNVVSSSLQMFPDTKKYSTQKQLIGGDSVVDGIVYKKLWWFSDANSDEKSLVVLLREDIEEQKVFAYDKGVEVLLYDLGVEVGDTIKVLGDLSDLVYDFYSTIIKENISLVVDNIDFIEDPIYGRLKVVTYYNADPNFNEFKCTVYERYGMTTGWLYNICMAYVGGGSQRVICAFDENDELVLKREYTIAGYGEVKDCYINEEIGTNVETPQKEENIYYNSQEKRLYVDIDNAEMIMVYDAVGKNIITKEVDLETKSISLNLNSGIYIVMTKNGNRYAKIVVK